ncbi:TIGR03663 family protein [Halogeometricum borinquense]|uniref:TIGR03663 family protein n=1 Tax=Halogeometricum borinquense TaxID=60847 RepID=A0A6C0UI86_9EURY|nr:flippase activity-associated protein Agl23 [Halogeometricum borinquense]QIB74313.1 TIGR03663 family protein [Halogeometricum borinquense]
MSKNRSLLDRVDAITLAVVGIALVGTALRLVGLGTRVFQYDEGWVGYWILQFMETGVWQYRPIVHGPFFIRVNSAIFGAIGVSDFSARLVVALLGGILPIAALLFRHHLRDSTVLAFAVLLTANPILLYYSRFMRYDLPLAAFSLFTLGFIVRAYDTGQRRYAYAAAVTGALAFTTKESVLLYLASWLGAAVLLLDYRFLRARDIGSDWRGVIQSQWQTLQNSIRHWGIHLLGAGVLWLAVFVFFYAPRAPGAGSVGFYDALRNPLLWPDVISEATVGSFNSAIELWGGGMQDHAYLPYLTDTLRTLAEGAPGIVSFSVVGFLYDRYVTDRPSDLVAFNFYVGISAIVGYPLANNFPVPWSTIHAVVPLALPAAIGVGVTYRWGRAAAADLGSKQRAIAGLLGIAIGGVLQTATASGSLTSVVKGALVLGGGLLLAAAFLPRIRALPNRLSSSNKAVFPVVVAALLLLSVGLHAAAIDYQTNYVAPTNGDVSPGGGSHLVYQSQPPQSLASLLATMDRVSDGNGTDVVFVGSRLSMNETEAQSPPGPAGWFARNPLPWYTEQYGVETENLVNPEDRSPNAPVVITTKRHSDTLAAQLEGYVGVKLPLDQNSNRVVYAFIERSKAPPRAELFSGQASPMKADGDSE